MKAKLIIFLKTVLAAALAAALHAAAENVPAIAQVLPPKYAGLAAVITSSAALYLAQSPRK
jgi:hypothetical protein